VGRGEYHGSAGGATTTTGWHRAGVNNYNGNLLMLGTMSGWDGSANPISTTRIGRLPRVLFLMTLLLLVIPWCPPGDSIDGWQQQLMVRCIASLPTVLVWI
jgi:hypothetical protein